ncbi:hypothetical protein L2U69_12095 [Zavarzinia compransoris]|uniref:hypothetical protein n=1 Tax=Zavarzinia marina TaxID=2911065 RepID=UPI001F2436DF|nr:hypothetical protein [Zavarzinia marina]MCF4166387.1 hypothetical protein [Zavarzinia marina]
MARQRTTTRRARALRAAFATLVLAAAFLLDATAAARADVDVIRDPARLRDMLAGRTLYGRYLNGDAVAEYYAPDGKAAYRQRQCLYAGRWWIERLTADFGIFEAGTPTVCFQYRALNPDGPPFCFAVSGTAGAERFYGTSGAPEYSGIPTLLTDHWAEGNAEPLSLEGDGCPSV